MTDIVDRQAQDLRFRRLSEFYAGIAYVNEAMLTSKTEAELFEGICRAVVNQGRLKAAWVGMCDTALGRIVPVAAVGDDQGYLQGITILLSRDDPRGRGPTASAVRERRPYWIQDFVHDPITEPWHDRATASGWRSSASLPLYRRGEVVGAFTLYSGEPHAFDVDVQRLLVDAAGNINFAIDSFANEAARRAVEEALKATEQRLRVGLRVAKVSAFNQDRDLRYLWASNPLFGYSSEQVVGHTDAELLPAAAARRVTEVKRRVIETGQPENAELAVDVDGKPVSFDLTVEPIVDGSGATVGIVGAASDVTARKHAEATHLLQSAALEAAANGIVITDREGVIEWANPAFCDLTGFTPEESVGRKPGELLKSGQHDPVFYEHMWKTIVEGGVWRGEVINKRKDGGLYTEDMTITPLKDAVGVIIHFIAVKQDITQQKALADQLRQAQKLDSIGQLAGGVAHDFNNMLAVILGFSELILTQMRPDEPLRKDLEEVQNAAKRSATLTRQLLAFARKQVVSPKVLDLNEAVDGILKMLRRLIGEDIDLAWQPAAELWKVRVDPGQVDQILANLCLNARDAIVSRGVSGKLTVATANATFDAGYCASHAECRPGDFVSIVVSDNGCGMDEETKGRIFEPFFTTKNVGEGTGLGLATVYGIVKQNEGLITCDSTPGKGTSFRLYLPRVLPEAVQNPKGGNDKIGRGTETVLIVDDELTVAIAAKAMLEPSGYHILMAETPGEGIRLAKEHAGEIHLLLTDLVMPVMSGWDLAAELSKRYPALKCLFMSGYTGDVIAKHLVREEGVHFLQKPFTRVELTAKVREALDER